MIIDYVDLFRYYGQCMEDVPWWVTLVCMGVHALAVVICLCNHRKDSLALPQKTSHNTLHTALWVVVLLTFPFVGILLYIAGSLVPYFCWKKKAGGNPVFPLGYRLRKYQLACLLIAGGAGMLLHPIANALAIRTRGLTLGYEVAFCAWMLLTLLDWNQAYRGKAVLMRLQPAAAESMAVAPAREWFGHPHILEQDAADQAVRNGVQAKRARAAADDLYAEESGTPVRTDGTVTVDGTAWTYRVVMQQNRVRKELGDVVDAQYLGRGVTRYRVVAWQTPENADAKSIGIEHTLYRVAPRIRFFLIRSTILFAIFLMLFSPQGTQVNLWILSLIQQFWK